MDLVTVYLVTCNRLQLLQRAARSVLRQSYSNIELIIVDDYSSDGTNIFLEKLTQRDSRVKIIQNREKIGACASRNKAVAAAMGKYITGLDDDDYFLRNRVMTFVEAYTHRKNDCIALCSNTITISSKRKRRSFRPHTIRAHDLIDQNFVGNQVFTTTKALRDIGGFDPILPAWQDLDTWYRLTKYSGQNISCIPQITMVIDQSHAFGRISKQRVLNIISARDIFEEKNMLSSTESRVLKHQLLQYEFGSFDLVDIFLRLRRSPTFRNIGWILKIYIKKLLS